MFLRASKNSLALFRRPVYLSQFQLTQPSAMGFSNFTDKLKDKFQHMKDQGLKETLKETFDTIKNVKITNEKPEKDQFGQNKEASMTEKAKDKFDDVKKAAESKFENLSAKNIKESAKETFQNVKDSKIVDSMKDKIEDIKDSNIGKAASRQFENLKDSNIGQKVQDTYQNLKDANITETIKDKAQNLKETITGDTKKQATDFPRSQSGSSFTSETGQSRSESGFSDLGKEDLKQSRQETELGGQMSEAEKKYRESRVKEMKKDYDSHIDFEGSSENKDNQGKFDKAMDTGSETFWKRETSQAEDYDKNRGLGGSLDKEEVNRRMKSFDKTQESESEKRDLKSPSFNMEQERDKDIESPEKGKNKIELGGTMTEKEKKYREQKFEELKNKQKK